MVAAASVRLGLHFSQPQPSRPTRHSHLILFSLINILGRERCGAIAASRHVAGDFLLLVALRPHPDHLSVPSLLALREGRFSGVQ